MQDTRANVELRFVSVATGYDVWGPIVKEDCIIAANGTTEILSGMIYNLDEELLVIAARLIVGGKCVSRHINWPPPLKYLAFTKRGVQIDAAEPRVYKVTVDRPTKGLVIGEIDGIHVIIALISCLEILRSSDPQITEYKGTEPGRRTAVAYYRYLGSEENQ